MSGAAGDQHRHTHTYRPKVRIPLPPRPVARGQKVPRHTSGWSRLSPIYLYVFQICFLSLNLFRRALNSLLGVLRAFRSSPHYNESIQLEASQTASERCSPSIPSSPWSVEEKTFSVVWGRCYAFFTSEKVVLFQGLLSPSQIDRFLNIFGMCELHLRTFFSLDAMSVMIFSSEFQAHSAGNYAAPRASGCLPHGVGSLEALCHDWQPFLGFLRVCQFLGSGVKYYVLDTPSFSAVRGSKRDSFSIKDGSSLWKGQFLATQNS